MLNFLLADNADLLNRCLKIRRTVFIVEKKVPETIEVDNKDQLNFGCFHFLVIDDGKDAGAFRITINDKTARLQRFCFLKDFRKKGLGSATLEYIEKYCRDNNVNKIEFDAKMESAPFYLKNNYRIVSSEFIEAGIPHVKMEKVL